MCEKEKGKEKVKGEKERRCGRTCEKQPSGRKKFWYPFGREKPVVVAAKEKGKIFGIQV